MIFERPQRLRAVKIGVAAAIARLEELRKKDVKASSMASSNPDDVLSIALQRLNIAEQPSGNEGAIEVVMSTATVDILSHPAVKYVHGDVDGDVYLERLVTLVRESEGRVERNESEIPEDLSQTDLYRKSKTVGVGSSVYLMSFVRPSVWKITRCYPRSYWDRLRGSGCSL
jgi:histone deacetylase HOS3